MVAMCEVTVGMKFIGNNARNRKKDIQSNVVPNIGNPFDC